MQEKLLPSTSTAVYVQVALPTPMRKYFDYLPPADKQTALLPGLRVQVPFGRQTLIGVVVAISDTTTVPAANLKHIIKIIDAAPIFPGKLYALLIWASTYYQYPLGLVFDAALTSPLRAGKIVSDYQQTYWKLTNSSNSTQSSAVKANKQQKLLELLAEHPAGIAEQALNSHGFNKSIRDKLLAKNLIQAYQASITTEALCSDAGLNNAGLQLNSAQQAAIELIEKSLGIFQTFLLDGVTGSGKTEIYLQMIAKVINEKKQVLILIPEISLTPQTLAQFQQRFNTEIIVYHSQISDKARTIAWFKASSGAASIIIGTRSAAFLPLAAPGLFIIDEEHDASFKQQEGFRYSARDLLIKRAQLESCPIILGSATPTLESIWNANNQRYCHVKLPERAGGACTPQIEILDIRHKKLKHGLSLQLLAEIEKHLANNSQVLLFLNRRGYAPVLMCGNCNWIQNCAQCSARMIIHFYPKPALVCHHCQTKAAMPTCCPSCSDTNLAPIGFGTEKLEQVLKTLFPQANILRVDSDVTSKKNAMGDIVAQVLAGEANILLGTQMLAKGHHFPNLSLVAILDIDGALFSSDFRTIERMGQLITQVAGRAGRAELPGHVMLQTQHPEHPLLQKLLTEGYHSLCAHLLAERQAAQLPPFGYQILLKAASLQPRSALDFLSWLKKQNPEQNKDIELLGPIPAPIEKKAKFFRAQLLIQSSNRSALHKICAHLVHKIADYPKLQQIQWGIDVDPIDFY